MGIYIMRPTADTAQADFTPQGAGANYVEVDEFVQNGDTDYNESSTQDHQDEFLCQDSKIPSGAGITSVIIYSYLRKVPGQAVNGALSVSAGASSGQSSDIPLTTSWALYSFDATSVKSWVPEDFDGSADSIKPGYIHRQMQARAMRSTMLYAIVLYDEPVPSKATTTIVDNSAVGTVAWSNPTFAQKSDDSYATAALNNSTSHYLDFQSFGFTIDSGDTILGIEARAERSKVGSTVQVVDNIVKLLKAGVVVGDNKAALTKWMFDDNEETGNAPSTWDSKYGSDTDLWGVSWSPSEINNSGFGIVLSAIGSIGAVTAQVDAVSITVYSVSADGNLEEQVHNTIL